MKKIHGNYGLESNAFWRSGFSFLNLCCFCFSYVERENLFSCNKSVFQGICDFSTRPQLRPGSPALGSANSGQVTSAAWDWSPKKRQRSAPLLPIAEDTQLAPDRCPHSVFPESSVLVFCFSDSRGERTESQKEKRKEISYLLSKF